MVYVNLTSWIRTINSAPIEVRKSIAFPALDLEVISVKIYIHVHLKRHAVIVNKPAFIGLDEPREVAREELVHDIIAQPTTDVLDGVDVVVVRPRTQRSAKGSYGHWFHGSRNAE